MKPYVIRFWETEFDDIQPVTSDSGQKLYARKDVEAILKIKKLLFDEKLTIPEARMLMKNLDEVDKEGVAAAVQEMADDQNVALNMVQKSLDLINEIKFKRKW